ncbi:MAG: hypothetical protein Hals2KO_32610 [Halioglobus sp.]
MQSLGKILITLSIAIFTFIPPIADLATTTHVFHPGWMPHARVHTVWLLGLTSSIGLVALYLLWKRKPDADTGLNLAAVLAACVYGAFFLSAITASLYGGALTDAEGGIANRIFGLDANVFTFSVASILLMAGWSLARFKQS